MNLVRRLFPLLALALLLAGCAPAAMGTSPGVPYPIDSQSIHATAGTTFYVEAHFTPADFAIDPTKLTGMMWVPSGYNADTAIITTKFSLDRVSVPAGWRLQMEQVQLIRTNVAPPTTYSKASTLRYDLAVLLVITPKAGAIAGPYHLSARLTYQKVSKPLSIALRLG